jgi:hypothetical protein
VSRLNLGGMIVRTNWDKVSKSSQVISRVEASDGSDSIRAVRGRRSREGKGGFRP